MLGAQEAESFRQLVLLRLLTEGRFIGCCCLVRRLYAAAHGGWHHRLFVAGDGPGRSGGLKRSERRPYCFPPIGRTVLRHMHGGYFVSPLSGCDFAGLMNDKNGRMRKELGESTCAASVVAGGWYDDGARGGGD